MVVSQCGHSVVTQHMIVCIHSKYIFFFMYSRLNSSPKQVSLHIYIMHAM